MLTNPFCLGEISADEFTMVQQISLPTENASDSNEGPVTQWVSEKLQTQAETLLNLKPIFPNLSNKSEEHHLVNLKGCILF